MKVLSDLELNEAGPEFEIVIKRLADSLIYGSNDSQFVGSGLTYAHSRPYEQGDSIKSIDWRVSARKGKYYIKEYEALKQIPIFLVMDTSASMCFTSTKQSKYSLALQVAGALAVSYLKQMNPVGICGAGDRDIFHPPSYSNSRIFQWLNDLRLHNFKEKTNLCQRLNQLSIFIKQRSLIIVLSDLHEEGAVAAIKKIHLEHDVIVLQMRDPAETEALKAGFFRSREAESQEDFIMKSSSRAEFDATHDELINHGIDHLVLNTEEDFTTRLSSFMKDRSTRGRA